MRRLLAAATTLALVAFGAVATGARAETGNRADDPVIRWVACTEPSLQIRKAECGFVSVPQDYAKPAGPSVELAVSRIKSTVPAARYQGIMLVNPGGPGGKGQGLSALGALVPKGAGAAYDWIGFDPRGVGASKPSVLQSLADLHDRPALSAA